MIKSPSRSAALGAGSKTSRVRHVEPSAKVYLGDLWSRKASDCQGHDLLITGAHGWPALSHRRSDSHRESHGLGREPCRTLLSLSDEAQRCARRERMVSLLSLLSCFSKPSSKFLGGGGWLLPNSFSSDFVLPIGQAFAATHMFDPGTVVRRGRIRGLGPRSFTGNLVLIIVRLL